MGNHPSRNPQDVRAGSAGEGDANSRKIKPTITWEERNFDFTAKELSQYSGICVESLKGFDSTVYVHTYAIKYHERFTSTSLLIEGDLRSLDAFLYLKLHYVASTLSISEESAFREIMKLRSSLSFQKSCLHVKTDDVPKDGRKKNITTRQLVINYKVRSLNEERSSPILFSIEFNTLRFIRGHEPINDTLLTIMNSFQKGEFNLIKARYENDPNFSQHHTSEPIDIPNLFDDWDSEWNEGSML